MVRRDESDEVVAPVRDPCAFVARPNRNDREITRIPSTFAIGVQPEAACVLLLVRKLDARRQSRSMRRPVNVMPTSTIVERVRGEFNEMPGLQLTLPQAARLWGLEPRACQDVIDRLVEVEFLRRTARGTIVRATK